jgi:hypothetical protein
MFPPFSLVTNSRPADPGADGAADGAGAVGCADGGSGCEHAADRRATARHVEVSSLIAAPYYLTKI